MGTIFKYDLQIKDRVEFLLPKDAVVLTIQMQQDKPKLWALVNPEETELERRYFLVFETGEEIDNIQVKYISTIQECNGKYIWHIFEEVNP